MKQLMCGQQPYNQVGTILTRITRKQWYLITKVTTSH